jgi:hypothetical protein
LIEEVSIEAPEWNSLIESAIRVYKKLEVISAVPKFAYV